MLTLTGARREEVGAMRWSEVDLAAKVWTLPKERTKNGVAHEIPLPRSALAIPEGLPRIGKGDSPLSRRQARRPFQDGRGQRLKLTPRS